MIPTKKTIGYIILIGIFSVLYVLMGLKSDFKTASLVYTISGILIGLVITAVNYINYK